MGQQRTTATPRSASAGEAQVERPCWDPKDGARTCHAHPTRSEAIKEAALAVGKRAIHM